MQQKICREGNINFIARFNCLITFFKKIQKQSPDVHKQSPEVFCKRRFLKNLQASQENTCVGVFFNKVVDLQPTRFLKKDSNTNAFL